MEKIITIDGPAASGKSALCRKLCQKWRGWDCISTGIFYRGVAYMIIQQKLQTTEQWLQCIQEASWKVEKFKEETRFFYQEQDITSSIYNIEIDNKASDIAQYEEVRKALIPYQKSQKQKNRGLIAEGRDCGTAIFPSAGLKIYLTATDQVRAKRRTTERNEQLDVVVHALQKRDKRDTERTVNPLKPAPEAIVIHTDQYSLEQIEEIVFKKAQTLFGPIQEINDLK